ncbi:MAG TPA: type VI secretion system-associated protein TagF [Rhodoblastus sp.]|nr:type VI secretion system-associated protein TagF [Rhodoblastus sp.]
MRTENMLYGKTPTRRDFIAVGAPRAFLSVWEPWVTACVSASRQDLNDGWRDSFLTAPIWRFWLGAEICGTATLGAIMPSMDGVGRYFPLTFAVMAESEEEFAPPETDPRAAWFEAVENFLLATLEGGDHESMLRDLAAVPRPSANGAEADGLIAGVHRAEASDLDFSAAFARSRVAAPARAAAASSFWWTLGGEDYAACALSCLRLPSPHLFSTMLTGNFAQGEASHA